LNLYQTGSTYVQNNDSSSIRQNEYYALLNWTISPHINWGIGYHYMNSKVLEKYSYNTYSDTYEPITVTDTLDLRLRGNMLFSKLTYTLNRFDFTLTGSVLTHDSAVLSGTILKFDSIKLTQQYGIHVGYSFPGKLNIYLKSSLYGLFETDNNKLLINKHLIFTQTAGLLFFKKLWVEGNVTLGYLKNYSDNNGLYIYNSLDPTKFRIGITTYWKIVPNISLFVNYTYDKKLIEKYNTNYNQHSLSSGIIWKL